VGIAIADTWYLRALQLLGAARTGVVASLYSPMMVLLSMLFLGERLSAWQYPGFVLVLGGILLVTWKHRKEDISKADLITGVAFGAGGVLLMATGIIMVKAILEQHEFFWTTTLRLMAGTAGMLIAMTWRKEWTHTLSIFKPSHFFSQQPWIYLISGSVLGTYLSMVFWLAGYRYTQASIASILNETAAVFIVIMAWLFLKEPLNLRKVLGIVLALSGVLVLLLGG
ncbi:MAG: DMT family transporter, partial [Xanthomonadales bacterium]|nr:DMT family transporter [Xanthomonadales bacterium]